MEILEPSSVRLSKSDKALAERLRKHLAERSSSDVLRLALRAMGKEYGLVEPEQQPVAAQPAQQQAA
jgi:hypothetical protein